mmetsp:Transcript_280/g.1094  ORF Transcript_280/g.1094 Transcript_280/m.1094 type:complete len:223 (+) Transcript_280:1662-2330(+)
MTKGPPQEAASHGATEASALVAPTREGEPGPSAWISAFHCWDGCECQRDLPVCCYASCCTLWAWAELMEALEAPALACPNSHALNALACMALTQCVQLALNVNPLCGFVGALLPAYCLRDSRKAIGAKYGVPLDSCCNPYAAWLFCTPCALYQELVFIKHVERRDFKCVCYVACGACVDASCGPDGRCRNPKPGDFDSRADGAPAGDRATTAELVVTAQPSH